MLKSFLTLAVVCMASVFVLWSPLQAQKLPPLRRLTPPFTANKLVILAKLRQKNFAALDAEFEGYQQAFEKSPAAELNEKLAFDSFATDDAKIGDLIAEWITAKPNSFAAHMALGCYFSWRGWHTRGAAPASETASTRFDKMRSYFDESTEDIKTALKIRPKLSVAYAVLLSEARGEADRPLQHKIESDALREIPASFIIRADAIECLYPRWGGDHALMAEFAQQSQAHVKENPTLHWLLGFIDLDDGEVLGVQGDLSKSIEALTKAIHKGGDFSGFYFSRGEGYLLRGQYEQALEDFDRADELSPQDPELLIRRASAMAKLGKPKEVLADLAIVDIFEAPNDISTGLHDWAVSANKKQR